MNRLQQMGLAALTVGLCGVLPAGTASGADAQDTAAPPIKVFILAGDENMLGQGVITGRTDGVHESFYPNPAPAKDEPAKHVNVAVYAGSYVPGADYDALTPAVTGLVEVGEQRTRKAQPGKRERVPVPMTPFPELAAAANHTTVLRGFVAVKVAGTYEFRPGTGEAACNVTTVEGREVYRLDPGAGAAAVTPIRLAPGRRHAFRTVFFGTPGHAFRLPLLDKPGALETVVAANPRYRFLKGKDGDWVTRDDVVLHDLHPIHNNTRSPGRRLQVGDAAYGGARPHAAIGPELMLGHVLGDAFEEPVLLVRFATYHPIWFARGSRSLGQDYLPPSSGATADELGGWDVIHFNFGVWDATYRDPTSKYFSGHHTTSVEDFGRNLRTLVARMKQTGATLIWGTVTPVWPGEPGRLNADEDAFNAEAAKVMQENGVIIDDLNAEVRRQGLPKGNNVHEVGNLGSKVTETIRKALADRPRNTKPLPRVLLIGDSITGTYQGHVMKALDGTAAVYKNPGNAEDTWNGLEKIDTWLDLKQYLLCGQEFLELVASVKDTLGNLERFYPGYSGQKSELAGLVWFQGIADCGSDAHAASYEANLANLVRDLRRDLNAPAMPAVVTAVGFGGTAMNGNTLKVHDAQMAVGDAARYPEFAGNVASVDTLAFWRPAEISPGGQASCYNENAQTFLEIGEAAGRAMLRLTGRDPGGRNPKKGLCLTTVRQNEATWRTKVDALNVSWHYSWGAKIPADEPAGVEFVPMVWGYYGTNAALAGTLHALTAATSPSSASCLLGFNEPDGKEQANLSVERALEAWPHLERTGLRLGSPAAVHADGEWMQTFMRQGKEQKRRVDFVCVHWYGGPSADGLISHLRKVHALYGKPIWLTEFAVADWRAASRAANRYTPEQVLRFMQAVLPQLDGLTFVERYAWFPAGEDDRALGPSALFEADGSLTVLGQLYAAHGTAAP